MVLQGLGLVSLTGMPLPHALSRADVCHSLGICAPCSELERAPELKHAWGRGQGHPGASLGALWRAGGGRRVVWAAVEESQFSGLPSGCPGGHSSDAGGDGLQGVPCSTGHAVATHQGQLASVLLPAVATACPEHATKPTSFLQQGNAGLCHESLCESPQLARWGSRADFVTKGSCISGCLLLFLIKQPGPRCRPSLWKGVCMDPAPHC